MTENNKNTGFTLVELIVVIVILAILATIAFLSFSNQSSSARDSKRLSDLSNISKGLGVNMAIGGKYFKPDRSVDIISGTTTIGYQGDAGDATLKYIKFSAGGGKDPLDATYYTYTTNYRYDKYELLCFLENASSLAYDLKPAFIRGDNTSALDYTNRYPYVKGDRLGAILYVSGSTYTPLQDSSSGTYLLTNTNTGTTAIIDNNTKTGATQIIGSLFLKNETPLFQCGTSNLKTVSSYGFSGSLCINGSSVTSWSGVGGNIGTDTLNWTCSDGFDTSNCSANYSKNNTSCNTSDKLVGSLTGAYQIWSMCNEGANLTYNGFAISYCHGSLTYCNPEYLPYLGNYYQWGRNDLGWSVGWTAPDDIWGGSGTDISTGTYESLGSPTSMKSVCQEGYHIPTLNEWCGTTKILVGQATSCTSGTDLIVQNALKFPRAGHIDTDHKYYNVRDGGYYWASSPTGTNGGAFAMNNNSWWYIGNLFKNRAASIRCMKN